MKVFILIIFLLLFPIGISFIPNWNLTESGKDLLSSSSSYEYLIYYEQINNIEIKMIKRLTKANDEITLSNIVTINNVEKEVSFNNIESVYYIFGHYLICPFGKYHVYNFTNEKYVIPNDFDENGDWNLKCFRLPALYNKDPYHQILMVTYSTKENNNNFFSLIHYTGIIKSDKHFSWYSLSFPKKFFDYETYVIIDYSKKILPDNPTICYYNIDNKTLFLEKANLIIKSKTPEQI